MAAPRPHPNALVWLLLSAAIIGLDQWSKAWVLSSLPEFQPVVVIDGFWNWYRTYNTGAAFSFLSDAGGWQKHFFTVLAIVISGLMAWWLRGTARGNWKAAVPYALIIGGDRQRDRPPGAWSCGRFHPVVRGQLHLALVQHRRFGHRGGCHRHRPVWPVRRQVRQKGG